MSIGPFPVSRLAVTGIVAALAFAAPARGAEPAELERDLVVAVDGVERTLDLEEAMAALKVPSVSLALIDGDRIAFAGAYGASATPETLYQAASLSKFVTAVGGLRLVEAKRLDLDADVNASLTSWKVPENALDKDHPVTLRGLLSMTAGINVPGFAGYPIGEPVPNLTQILYGVPPANSPPVTVIAEPGSAYRYSGGSYEIAEALMVDTMGASFPELMKEAVLDPAGMSRSSFASTLPADLERQAMHGHLADGSEIHGGYHIYPEHAAASLWSTPTDLANLLLLIGRAWRGESQLFLAPETVRTMLTRQSGGPYGLGAAIGETGGILTAMKRGQNAGFQSYLILLPAEGKGMVVMTNSDNGSILAEALIRRAAKLFDWPALGALAD
ncbi:MAG: serine hydrolase domain-containing protein [Methyloceanibacter sp.]